METQPLVKVKNKDGHIMLVNEADWIQDPGQFSGYQLVEEKPKPAVRLKAEKKAEE